MKPPFRWLLPVVVACAHGTPADTPAARLPLAVDPLRLLEAVPDTFADGTRIHLATDRAVFRPGDTIRLQSWSVSGAALAAEPDDGLGPPGMRYDLVNPQGSAVSSILVAEEAGFGRASLDLDPDAPGGLWTIRAVAHDGTVRERRVVVVPFEAASVLGDVDFEGDGYGPGDRVTATGTLRRPTGEPLAAETVDVALLVDGTEVQRQTLVTHADGSVPVAFDLPAVVGDALIVLLDRAGGSIARPVPVADGPPSVQVFPEGGDLVAGLGSRVYLEVTDRHGEPVDATGRVVDDAGAEIARFVARRGRAVVRMTPEASGVYRVIVERPGASETPMPAVAAEGCVLETRDDVDGAHGALRVQVRCTEDREVVVLATLRGAWFDAARVRTGTGGAVVDLAPTDAALAEAQGVVQVTVLGHDGAPVAERVVYRNRGRDLVVTVTPSVPEAVPGQDVEVVLTAADPSGAPVDAMLAVAAVDDAWASATDEDLRDIRSALLLEPTVGEVDDPSRFLDRSDPRSAEDLDRLLGARGWRRFRRAEIASGPLPSPPPVAGPAPDAAADGQVLQRIPAGRTYQTMVQPGAGGNPNMAGSASSENTYLLDGANITDPVTGTFSLNFGFDSVQVVSRSIGDGPEPPVRTLHDVDTDRITRLHQYDACFEREARRTPDLGGTFYVNASVVDGRASRVDVQGYGSSHGGVMACISHVVGGMRFPAGHPRWASGMVATGRAGSGADLPFTVVRELPPPPQRVPGVRTDFRPTVLWTAARTGKTGEARVRLVTSDAVTGFRIVAEGVGEGLAGKGEAVLASRPPLSSTLRVPPRLVQGDRVQLPVVLDNATDGPLEVVLGVEAGEALVAMAPREPIVVPGRSTVTAWVGVRAVRTGEASIRVTTSSGTLADALDRTLRVDPPGFPALVGGTEVLRDGVVRVALDTRHAMPGTIGAEVEVAPGAAGALPGLDGMLREPHGCFEQTSATSYPNLLVLDWMERTRQGDRAARAQAEDLVGRGVARLATFETPSGGFDWYGRAPGHVALTAYGLRQLVRTDRVHDVDPALIDRIAEWLLDRRTADGEFVVSASGYDRWSATDPTLTTLYATWALAEAGRAEELAASLERAREVGSWSEDPHQMALAALALRTAGEDAAPITARLSGYQGKDGSFPGAGATLTRSSDPDRLVETTALVALALDGAGAEAERSDALAWLAGARQASGTWGATQATILAMEALIAEAVPSEALPLTVDLDGARLGTLGVPQGLVASRLPLPLGRRVSWVTLTGPVGVPATVRASFRVEDPPDDPGAPLSLGTSLAGGPHRAGEIVRLSVAVHDRSGDGQASPIARIGIPAGLSVPAWQIDDLVDQGRVAAIEVGAGEVVLYWDGIDPSATLEVALDLTAEFPGTTTGAPSSAWPYYASGSRTWTPPLAIAVLEVHGGP